MKISKTDCLRTPKTDGFYMPGEFEPHEGTLMIWPWRPGSWNYGAKAARAAFAEIAEAIAAYEQVYPSGHRIKHRHRNCFPPTGFI